MDLTTILSIAGSLAAVIAIVAVPYQILAYRRQHPKRRLEYTVSSSRIVSNALLPGLVEVLVRGIRVDDPHLLQVTIFSNSRADITSATFDAGRSIAIRVTPPSIGIFHDEGGAGEKMEVTLGLDSDAGATVIPPQLIRPGAEVQLTFISSGPPTVEISNPLIDLEIRPVGITLRDRVASARERRTVIFSAMATLAVLAALLTLVFTLAPR